MARPFLMTITGPSCSGKTTLEAELVEGGFARVVSHTTRPIREGEVDGEHYHFKSVDDFLDIPMAEVVTFNGNMYGTSVAELERCHQAGMPIVLIVEPVGLGQMTAFCKNNSWQHFSVFVDTPAEVIAERYLNRALAAAHAESILGRGSKRDRQQVASTFASRLGTMMTTEREWVASARSGYSTIVESYTEDTMDKVLEDLLYVATEKMGNWHWMTDFGHKYFEAAA